VFSIKEKRKVTRTIIDIPISVKSESDPDKKWHVTTLDISISGLQLRSLQPIEVGSTISLEFPKEWQGLTLVANVVRQSGDCFGCQLLDVKPTEQEVLDHAIWQANINNLAEKYRGDPDQAFFGPGYRRPADDEMRRVRRRLEELENEVALLKQSTEYLEMHSR